MQRDENSISREVSKDIETFQFGPANEVIKQLLKWLTKQRKNFM